MLALRFASPRRLAVTALVLLPLACATANSGAPDPGSAGAGGATTTTTASGGAGTSSASAGGGGSGGATGAGGSGTTTTTQTQGSTCDVYGDCATCANCAQSTVCTSQLDACALDDACYELIMCTGACTTTACVQTCLDAAPTQAAKQEYLDFYLCVSCSCALDCKVPASACP